MGSCRRRSSGHLSAWTKFSARHEKSTPTRWHPRIARTSQRDCGRREGWRELPPRGVGDCRKGEARRMSKAYRKFSSRFAARDRDKPKTFVGVALSISASDDFERAL